MLHRNSIFCHPICVPDPYPLTPYRAFRNHLQDLGFFSVFIISWNQGPQHPGEAGRAHGKELIISSVCCSLTTLKSDGRLVTYFQAKTQKMIEEVLKYILVKADVPLQDRTCLEVGRWVDGSPCCFLTPFPIPSPPLRNQAFTVCLICCHYNTSYHRIYKALNWLQALQQVNYCFELD